MQPDSETTQAIVSKLRAGSGNFDALFQRHRQALKAAVRLRLDARTRARFDASDVIQETHAEAYRRLEDYLVRQPMPFQLWLRKTAIEQLIMLRRKHVGAEQRSVKRERALSRDSAARIALRLIAASPSPSEVINERERAEGVRRAISQLPAADQEILLMRIYEGLSYEEIGCVLSIEPAAARQRNGRAIIRLHQLLVESGMTESQL